MDLEVLTVDIVPVHIGIQDRGISILVLGKGAVMNATTTTTRLRSCLNLVEFLSLDLRGTNFDCWTFLFVRSTKHRLRFFWGCWQLLCGNLRRSDRIRVLEAQRCRLLVIVILNSLIVITIINCSFLLLQNWIPMILIGSLLLLWPLLLGSYNPNSCRHKRLVRLLTWAVSIDWYPSLLHLLHVITIRSRSGRLLCLGLAAAGQVSHWWILVDWLCSRRRLLLVDDLTTSIAVDTSSSSSARLLRGYLPVFLSIVNNWLISGFFGCSIARQ